MGRSLIEPSLDDATIKYLAVIEVSSFRMIARLLPLVLLCHLLVYVPTSDAAVTVNVTGVSGRLKAQILATLALSRLDRQDHATPASIRSMYQRSLTDIDNVLKSNGFYRYELSDELEQEDENWNANFGIILGVPVIIKNLEVKIDGEGSSDIELTRAAREFPLKLNSRLEHGLYESGKGRIENIARQRGYFDAVFTTHVINIDESANTAAIELVLDSGKRYLFGAVLITETVVDRDVLDKFVPFREGSPYDANQLITLGQSLRSSNYFNDVTVIAVLENVEDYRVPVLVTLTPKPQNNIRVGIGYGTDSGPRLVGSWDNHYINRRGHRVETDLKLSPTYSDLTGLYGMPDFRLNGAEVDLVTSLSSENTDTHSSDAFKLGVRQNRLRRDWNEVIGLTYQFESFQVADIDRNSNLLMPEITYWKTVTDSPVYTTSGYRFSIGLKGSVQGALSDMSFLQALVNAKYIFPVSDKSRVITRAELGATSVKNFDKLPASIRFFAGGDNSIRGFDLQTLGPRNAAGEVIGGKYLATGSLEYEVEVINNWSVALFTDAGNAYNEFSDHFVYSGGAGIRWKTPVGLIRVDLAVGLSEDSRPIRLHINVGPDL
jgi:translocation and assembly module TamA